MTGNVMPGSLPYHPVMMAHGGVTPVDGHASYETGQSAKRNRMGRVTQESSVSVAVRAGLNPHRFTASTADRSNRGYPDEVITNTS